MLDITEHGWVGAQPLAVKELTVEEQPASLNNIDSFFQTWA